MSNAGGQAQENNARLQYHFPNRYLLPVIGRFLPDRLPLRLGKRQSGEHSDDYADQAGSVIAHPPALWINDSSSLRRSCITSCSSEL